jgi:hypothetical protein
VCARMVRPQVTLCAVKPEDWARMQAAVAKGEYGKGCFACCERNDARSHAASVSTEDFERMRKTMMAKELSA